MAYQIFGPHGEPVGRIYKMQYYALEAAKKMAQKGRSNYEVRSVADPIDWRARERRRFCLGEYKYPIWQSEKWAADDWDLKTGHFPHVSKTDPKLIAYTPDDKYGEEDRQVTTTPGRYLTKYYSKVLTADQIRTWAALFEGGDLENLPPLCFTSDPEQIYQIYRTGPGSCMKGSPEIRGWGGGNVQLAYIGPVTKVLARSLVLPETKKFVRIYANDHKDREIFRHVLTKDGYSEGSLRGAKVPLTRHKQGLCSCGDPTCHYSNREALSPPPYLDGAGAIQVEGDFYIVR